MTLSTTLLAATLAAQAMTGAVVAEAPIQQEIQQQSQVQTASVSSVNAWAYSYQANTISHNVTIKGDSSNEGKLVTWEIQNSAGVKQWGGSAKLSFVDGLYNTYSTDQITSTVGSLAPNQYYYIVYRIGTSQSYVEFYKTSSGQITAYN